MVCCLLPRCAGNADLRPSLSLVYLRCLWTVAFCSHDSLFTISRIFSLTRFLQESHTFGGEIDYRVYCEFQVAWLHRSTSKGIKYFFKLLDLKKRGFVLFIIPYCRYTLTLLFCPDFLPCWTSTTSSEQSAEKLSKLLALKSTWRMWKTSCLTLWNLPYLTASQSTIWLHVGKAAQVWNCSTSNPFCHNFDLFARTVIAILADWQSFYEHDNKENQLAASASEEQETWTQNL